MCGFCGFTGSLADGQLVLGRMMHRIFHRGPDSGGMYIDSKVHLGFRRLSIIDLNKGSQPMFNETGEIVITFNGEIYNFQELRIELLSRGHKFNNTSDTEVLIHAYEEYGEKMLTKLQGMFSFVIWDSKKNTLFAARDPFGIKPFYYTKIGDNLIFGSEIKSILEHPLYNKEVNKEALESYLTFQYSVLEETFFSGIYKLMPAHYLIFKNGSLKKRKYWEPKFEPDYEKSLEEFIDEIDDSLQDSFKSHMLSDVEVGSFLSSGVDSSYVASCFNGDKTFTVGFDYEKYNEISYAKRLSKLVGVESNSKIISTKEYWKNLGLVQYHMDEPLADPSAIALYFVSKLASKQVKVVLSGEGADELFGGYNIYREPADLLPITIMPNPVSKSLAFAVNCVPFQFKGKNYIIRGSKKIEDRFIGNAFIFKKKEREKILNEPLCTNKPSEITEPFYEKVKDLDPVTKMQYIDIHLWLQGDILLKADKMSMANSLEVRVPFLDKHVFDVARKLPPDYKVNKENTKFAMRISSGKYLPDDVAEKKKLGFPVPIRIWLKEDKYYDIVKSYFEKDFTKKFFNTEAILKLLKQHKQGKLDNSRKIWTIYTFLIWYEEFFIYFDDNFHQYNFEDELSKIKVHKIEKNPAKDALESDITAEKEASIKAGRLKKAKKDAISTEPSTEPSSESLNKKNVVISKNTTDLESSEDSNDLDEDKIFENVKDSKDIKETENAKETQNENNPSFDVVKNLFSNEFANDTIPQTSRVAKVESKLEVELKDLASELEGWIRESKLREGLIDDNDIVEAPSVFIDKETYLDEDTSIKEDSSPDNDYMDLTFEETRTENYKPDRGFEENAYEVVSKGRRAASFDVYDVEDGKAVKKQEDEIFNSRRAARYDMYDVTYGDVEEPTKNEVAAASILDEAFREAIYQNFKNGGKK